MIIGLNGFHSPQLHALGIDGLHPSLITQRSLCLNTSGPWVAEIHHASQYRFRQVEDSAVCIRYLGLCSLEGHGRGGVYHGAEDGESSVDHGSNREPRGEVRPQTKPCTTPTVRFAPQTAPRRHGSVCRGGEPPRFAMVRHGSRRFAMVRLTSAVHHGSPNLRSPPRFFMVRDIFSRGFHTHTNISSQFFISIHIRAQCFL